MVLEYDFPRIGAGIVRAVRADTADVRDGHAVGVDPRRAVFRGDPALLFVELGHLRDLLAATRGSGGDRPRGGSLDSGTRPTHLRAVRLGGRLAADRVATVVGRLGKIVAAVTALSTLAFLLIPMSTGLGAPAFLVVVIVWSITSSALRAPPLKLLGRYTPPDQQPWVGSLFLLGIGIASALAPFLAGWITAYDPRIMFAASAGSVVVVTLSIIWAEKTLARSEPSGRPAGGGIRSAATLGYFLAAVLLLAIGFQVHSYINAQPLFLRFSRPADLPPLLSLFWIGFSLLMLPASLLTKRFGGFAIMASGALVGAASAWAAAHATDVFWLGVAQFVSVARGVR